MTVLPPETTQSLGNTVIGVLVTPPANPAAPTKAELNAAVFIACFFYGDGFSATPTQTKGEGPAKFCSKVNPQRLGKVTYELADIQASYVPQEMGTPGYAANKAIETLEEGTEVFIFEGPGIDGESGSVATGDVINLYKRVECGAQRRGRTGSGEYDEFSFTQSLILADGTEPQYDYVVPAA